DRLGPLLPPHLQQTTACHPNPGYFLSHFHFTITVVSSTTFTRSVTAIAHSDLWPCISPAPSLLHSTFN
uniref:Ovule protein n=1 Tax=Mesocestoides corti TaxID=53468 RepID=A0A5K3G094_MESCO